MMIDIFLNFTNDELPINVAGANAPLIGGAVFSINVAAANAAKNVVISKAAILKIENIEKLPIIGALAPATFIDNCQHHIRGALAPATFIGALAPAMFIDGNVYNRHV
jgi:hypothetical protein